MKSNQIYRQFLHITYAFTLSIFLSTHCVDGIRLGSGISLEETLALARELKGSYSTARGYFTGQDPQKRQSVQPVHFVSKKHILALHPTSTSIETIKCDFPDAATVVKVIKSNVLETKFTRNRHTLILYELEKEIESAIPFQIIKERRGVAGLLDSDSLSDYVCVFTYSNAMGNPEKNLELKAVPIEKSEQTQLWVPQNQIFAHYGKTHHIEKGTHGSYKFILDQNDMGCAMAIAENNTLTLIGVGIPTEIKKKDNFSSRFLKLSYGICKKISNLIKQNPIPSEGTMESSSASLPIDNRNEEPIPDSLNSVGASSTDDSIKDAERQEKTTNCQTDNSKNSRGQHSKSPIKKRKRATKERVPNIFDDFPLIDAGDLICIDSNGTWFVNHNDNARGTNRYLGILVTPSKKSSCMMKAKKVEQGEDYIKIISKNRNSITIYRCGYILSVCRKKDVEKRRGIYVNGWTYDSTKSKGNRWSYQKPERSTLLKERTCNVDGIVKTIYADDKIETRSKNECRKIRNKRYTEILYPHQVRRAWYPDGLTITFYPNGFIFTQETKDSCPSITLDLTSAKMVEKDLTYEYANGKKETIYVDGRLEMRYRNGGQAIFHTDRTVELQACEGQRRHISLSDLIKNPAQLRSIEFPDSGLARAPSAPQELAKTAEKESICHSLGDMAIPPPFIIPTILSATRSPARKRGLQPILPKPPSLNFITEPIQLMLANRDKTKPVAPSSDKSTVNPTRPQNSANLVRSVQPIQATSSPKQSKDPEPPKLASPSETSLRYQGGPRKRKRTAVLRKNSSNPISNPDESAHGAEKDDASSVAACKPPLKVRRKEGMQAEKIAPVLPKKQNIVPFRGTAYAIRPSLSRPIDNSMTRSPFPQPHHDSLAVQDKYFPGTQPDPCKTQEGTVYFPNTTSFLGEISNKFEGPSQDASFPHNSYTTEPENLYKGHVTTATEVPPLTFDTRTSLRYQADPLLPPFGEQYYDLGNHPNPSYIGRQRLPGIQSLLAEVNLPATQGYSHRAQNTNKYL